MKNNLAVVLLVLFGALSQVANACSCPFPEFDDVYRDSDVVYVAEVITVRVVADNPRHNSPATYEVALRPVRIFKGRNPGIQRARFVSTYHDRSSFFPFSDITEGIEVTDSCDMGFRIGELVLVFKKDRERLGNVDPCSTSVVQDPSRELVSLVEELSQ